MMENVVIDWQNLASLKSGTQTFENNNLVKKEM